MPTVIIMRAVAAEKARRERVEHVRTDVRFPEQLHDRIVNEAKAAGLGFNAFLIAVMREVLEGDG